MFQGMDDAAKASLMQTMNMVSDVDNLQCQMFAHQGGVRGVAAIQQTYNAAEVAFLARKPPWEMDGGPVLAEKERRHSAGGQLVSYGACRLQCVRMGSGAYGMPLESLMCAAVLLDRQPSERPILQWDG